MPPRRHRLSVLLSTLVLGSSWLLVPDTGADPIEGTVREASGAPIASARVELRDGSNVVSAARTDADGRFRLKPGEPAASTWELRIVRLGYAPSVVPVSADREGLEIVLEPSPLPLPEFTVEREADACARREDEEAREVWRRAASRHAGGLDSLGIATYTRVRSDTLDPEAARNVSVADATSAQRASAPLLRLSWERRVQREGYAFPVRRTDRARSYDSWSYPPLEADFASHFAGEVFGNLHTFHMERVDSTGWLVRFCGRERELPYLEGVLDIDADTLIQRAEWRFHTPEPDEAAGGWSRFPPADPDGASPRLLPTESMTWRSLPDERVLRRAQWYEEWITAPGDSVPFLPERRTAGGS